MQATFEKNQRNEVFDKLADEAWRQLGCQSLEKLVIDDIAKNINIDPRVAVAIAGCPQQLVLGKIAALDDLSILESFTDIEDAGAISVREKILEALMHRFEVFKPYRQQIDSLKKSSAKQPDLVTSLFRSLNLASLRILAMAGDNCNGWRGKLRLQGIVGVVLVVGRVWMKDESSDLAPTMKELDHRLRQAEEWAVSIGIV